MWQIWCGRSGVAEALEGGRGMKGGADIVTCQRLFHERCITFVVGNGGHEIAAGGIYRSGAVGSGSL